MSQFRWLALVPVFSFCCWIVSANPDAPKPQFNPTLAKASDEAIQAIPRFKVPAGMKTEVWAAEPLLAHPVAFCFDEKGNCYVAETFRHSNAATDNRAHMYWLDEELANRTVAERVAMFKKYAKEKFDSIYTSQHDRIRKVVDTNGDGKADQSTVFSDRFNRPEDGLGAGLLARKGNVYYTCIPDLWLLKDTKGTGTADVQQSLSTGYGVHVAFIGHDLHGLRMGPDGKLYFTIGDRGMNVTSREGKHLFYPDTGAVMRCDPDGANLEVIATGLRNPQELAFDDYGNLFTVDNNSDSGDRARFVYLVEGGDSGWRIAYQYESYLSSRGPWNYEKLWHPQHEGQPAYIIPPITNFSDGPSGFTHYPGIGLNDQYKGHFFLCDFRGNSGDSGVYSFSTKPKGAGFELINPDRFIWSILATDCEFGPDGAFYISDWVEGWNPAGKGRIYRFTDTEAMKNPAIAQTKKLLAEGFDHRPIEELMDLMNHPHQQIRLEAQYALAEKGTAAVEPLTKMATSGPSILARIHAIWALGQISRKEANACQGIQRLLQDPQAEIRSQTAKVLGDTTKTPAEVLVPLLKDTEPRVRFFTAMALSKAIWNDAKPIRDALLEVLKQNADKDVYIRHGCVMALANRCSDPLLLELAKHESSSVRLAGCLAFRRKQHPAVADYLLDTDPKIIEEAARAIHDEAIASAYLPLAHLLTNKNAPESAKYRSMNIHFRLGKHENVSAIAALVPQADIPEKIRVLALKMLAEWSQPRRRDFITGLTQNLGTRPGNTTVDVLRPILSKALPGSALLQREALITARKLGIKEVGPLLFALVSDLKAPSEIRMEALNTMESLHDSRLQEGIRFALEAKDPKFRTVGRTVLSHIDPKRAIEEFKKVLEKGDRIEKQTAFTDLGAMSSPEATTLLEQWLDKLIVKQVPADLQLDLLEAVAKQENASVKSKLQKFEESRVKTDELANYRETLEGGNAERGKQIFLNHAASCQRCHKVNNEGGEVGPALNGLGQEKSREYLLEAIVLPNKQIAKGYESVLINTLDGQAISGIIRGEDAKEVKLITAEAKLITIQREDIEDRRPSKSAMPEDLAQKLSKRELRDLIEFMVHLKK